MGGPQTHFSLLVFKNHYWISIGYLKPTFLHPFFSWTLFGDEIFLRMELKVKAKYSCDRVHTSLFHTFCWRFSPHPPNLNSLHLFALTAFYLQPLLFLHLCHHILSSLWHFTLITLNISVQLYPMLGLISNTFSSVFLPNAQVHFLIDPHGFGARTSMRY